MSNYRSALIYKISSLNKGGNISHNMMAYKLSLILNEKVKSSSIQTTPEQEESARKELSEIFSAKSNVKQSREELANKFRDRFLMQMKIEPNSKQTQGQETQSQQAQICQKQTQQTNQKNNQQQYKSNLPTIKEIRQAIPQIIRAIMFRGISLDTRNKIYETKDYKTSLKLDNNNQKLTVERKKSASQIIALEAIKEGKGEFEIINNYLEEEELQAIKQSLKDSQSLNNQLRHTTNRSKDKNIEI